MDKKDDKINRHANDNSTMIELEIKIPKSKVGMIIGKASATIKNLRESSGAKMSLMNQTQENTQLRINGNESQVNEAEKLVRNLLNVGEEMMFTGQPNELKTLEFKNLASEAYTAKKYDEALSYYDRAIEACPKDPVYGMAKLYRTRASVYEVLGKFDKVIDDCNKVAGLIPRCVDTRLRRARAFEKQNELQKALEDANYVSKSGSISGRIIADRIKKKLENEKNKTENNEDERGNDDGNYFFSSSVGRMLKLQIQREMRRVIIGKNGSSIREIRKETGANCEFDGSVVDRDQEVVGLLIKGTTKQMEHAKRMIEEIIDRHATENSLVNDFIKLNVN